MKVLHLLQSSRFSGAENVVCQIIKMSENDDNNSMLYCSKDGQIRDSLRDREIPFVPIKKLSVSEVKKVIRHQKPDLIHAHDRNACVVAAMAAGKIPVVSHMHVNNKKGFASFVKNTVWVLMSWKYRHVFWVSDSAYNQFGFKKIVQKKSTVLYNVIDSQALLEKAKQDENRYDYDVVYVGRLSHQKNPERLMEVLHKVVHKKNDVKVAIVGNGEYSEYVAEYIQKNKLNENVYYLGYNNNPLRMISEAKVLIMTSRYEGTPMVALEAQCLGVPVVSTPVDGMKAIIKNGYNGYLSDDNDELAKETVAIITDTVYRKRLKNNSLKDSKEYNDIERFYSAITAVYGLCEGEA